MKNWQLLKLEEELVRNVLFIVIETLPISSNLICVWTPLFLSFKTTRSRQYKPLSCLLVDRRFSKLIYELNRSEVNINATQVMETVSFSLEEKCRALIRKLAWHHPINSLGIAWTYRIRAYSREELNQFRPYLIPATLFWYQRHTNAVYWACTYAKAVQGVHRWVLKRTSNSLACSFESIFSYN